MKSFSGPHVMRRMRRARGAALATFAAASAAAAPVSASAAPMKGPASAPDASGTSYCPLDETPLWKAFAAFGDNDDYFMAPSGDFESGATDWRLRGAYVGSGNDDLGVRPGSRSLSLGIGVPGNPVAVSPVFCITGDHPVFRFTFRSIGRVGPLSAALRYRAADGSTRERVVALPSSTAVQPGVWQPSERLPLADALASMGADGTAAVQLVFRAQTRGPGSGYQVDNVLIDPYRMR